MRLLLLLMSTRYLSACLVLQRRGVRRQRPQRRALTVSTTTTAVGSTARGKDRSSSSSFVESRRHLHVGNLDWTRSVAQVTEDLRHAVGGATLLRADPTSAVPYHVAGLPPPCVVITVKPVRPDRVRDAAKSHGGSAVLEFASSAAAARAWDALLLQPQQSTTTATTNYYYRVKYAVLEEVVPPAPPPTLAELARRRERAERSAARRVRLAARTDILLDRLAGSSSMSTTGVVPVLDAPNLDWRPCPAPLDPLQGGGLDAESARGTRKRAAVEAFCVVVTHLLGLDAVVDTAVAVSHRLADLGCGSGNLALPLQWALSNATTTPQQRSVGMLAVDRNPQSLERLVARATAATATLTTITTTTVDVLSYDLVDLIRLQDTSLDDVSMVVSLHACGAASDMAMAAAVARGLPFAISPCCIGKINNQQQSSGAKRRTSRGLPPLDGASATTTTMTASVADPFTYPRSQWLQQAVTAEEYQLLAKAADYGVVYNHDDETDDRTTTTPTKTQTTEQEVQRRQRCRRAKRVVERDRLAWAAQQGYAVRLLELPRIGPLYPKRELLVGAPCDSPAAARMFALATLDSTRNEEDSHGGRG